jgi:predicted nucleotidyltransferase
VDKQKLLDQLVERLKSTFGEALVSVVLYGSAADGDYDPRFSDVNIFCVLKQVALPELSASEPVFRWWREKGNPAPLLMNQDEVLTSTDCFPIEFHDMKDRRRVLFGADSIADLAIDDVFYRAQVEYQLRAKLLRLRQKGACVLYDNQLLLDLMTDSITTFVMLGRHALRLHGETPAIGRRQVVNQIESHFGINCEPFRTLLDIRERQPSQRSEPRALYSDYLKTVEVLVGAVDRLAR